MAIWKHLQDVESAARENPDHFFIPALHKSRNQQVGDSVRLHFLLDEAREDEPRAERMWVTVTRECTLFKGYLGRLQNTPGFIENLTDGDEVAFKPKHIARVLIKKTDPEWIDSSEQRTLVSKMCLEPGHTIRFFYRQEADREEVSGWRMFTGLESEEYNDDPENIAIVDVGWMLDRDPTLLEPLKQGIGAVFEREERGTGWKQVFDWTPEE